MPGCMAGIQVGTEVAALALLFGDLLSMFGTRRVRALYLI